MSSSIHNLFASLMLPWLGGGAAPGQGMEGASPEFAGWLGQSVEQVSFDALAQVEQGGWGWSEVRFEDDFDGPFFFYTPRSWSQAKHRGRQATLGEPERVRQSIQLCSRSAWAPALERYLGSHRITAFDFAPLLLPHYCRWLFATAPDAEHPPWMWCAWSAGDWIVLARGDAPTLGQGREQIASMLLSAPWHGWIEAVRARSGH